MKLMANDYHMVVETHSAEETRAWGSRLGRLLAPGDIIALVGELGSGKTVFVQGLAQGLGVSAAVTSPTFTLINEYRTPSGLILHHVDCYRLADAVLEMWDIGLTDLLAGEDIVVIEWADRVAGLLPQAYLEVSFFYLDETRRRICFTGHGSQGVALLRRLEAVRGAGTLPLSQGESEQLAVPLPG